MEEGKTFPVYREEGRGGGEGRQPEEGGGQTFSQQIKHGDTVREGQEDEDASSLPVAQPCTYVRYSHALQEKGEEQKQKSHRTFFLCRT